MSDSNLSPVAGSRVKSSATDLDSYGRKKSTGYPTEPTQGMERDMGVLCLVGWVFRSPPDYMSAAARPSSIPCPKGRCRCGFRGGHPWEWAPSKMRFGVCWERRVQSNRPDDGQGRGAWGGECRKVTPPRPPTSSHRLDFFATPLSAWAAPLPSSAVATRGRGSSLSPALPPWTPASRKEERDTWDMGVWLRFRTEGQRAETWSHGAKPQKKKAPRGRQVHI